jgi:hypothetical protein
MNRRNFLKFCSFTFASLGTVSYIQNPVVSTRFNISEEEVNPRDVNVLLFRFKNLSLKPKYLDSTMSLTISTKIKIDENAKSSKVANGVNFRNGEDIGLSKIRDRWGVNLSNILVQGINEKESSTRGVAKVKIEHPDISVQEYIKDFEINAGNLPPDSIHMWNFNDEDRSQNIVKDRIGTADGELNGSGAVWESNPNMVGNNWLYFDGDPNKTEDYVEVSSGQSIGDSGTIFITINTDTFYNPDGDFDIRTALSSLDDYIYLQVRSPDNIVLLLDDADMRPSGMNTSTNYRIAIRWDRGNVSMWINGQNKTGVINYSGEIQTVGNWIFGRVNPDPGYQQWKGYLDNIIMSNTAVDQSEIQEDYNRQPWS